MIQHNSKLGLVFGIRPYLKRVLLWIGAIGIASLVGYLALPYSLVIWIPPFALENVLFGTAYLSNMLSSSLASWFIEVGLLFLPLLGRGKKQVVRLVIAAYIILPIIVYGLVGIVSAIDNRLPGEVAGPEPDLVSDALPLPEALHIAGMKWSPDGRFIAIGMYVNSNSQGRVIFLFEVDTGDEAAQIPGGGPNLFWSKDNRLWILAGNHWEVYSEPFTQKQLVPLGYENEEDEPLAYKKWAFSPDSQILAVAEADWEEKVWNIRLWKGAAPLQNVRLKPRYDEYGDGGPRDLELFFSQNGAYLALVISGWLGYEQPGPEELWVLDVGTGNLRFLHEGKTKSWKFFDYETQDVTLSWSPTAEELVFGGFEFPMESINLNSGRVTHVLGWNTEIYDPLFSKTGDWIAFERWPSDSEDRDHCLRCFGALKYQGNELVYLDDLDWPYIWYDWHARENTLAVLTGEGGHYRLLLWRLVN